MSLDDGGVAVLGPQKTVGGQSATSTISHACAGPISAVVEQLLRAITNVLVTMNDERTPMWNAGLQRTVEGVRTIGR